MNWTHFACTTFVNKKYYKKSWTCSSCLPLTTPPPTYPGPQGLQVLTNIAIYSYSHNTIPNIWKHGKIITIPRPNKDPTDPASYRPITLLCTPSKVIERLILQHGFRPLHSTNTLLTDLTQRVFDGINSSRLPHRTLLITLDISKAFDATPRHNLTNNGQLFGRQKCLCVIYWPVIEHQKLQERCPPRLRPVPYTL